MGAQGAIDNLRNFSAAAQPRGGCLRSVTATPCVEETGR